MPKGVARRRRSVLKLMAGSIAGASLRSLPHAWAADVAAGLDDGMLRLEFDAALRSRVLAGRGRGFEPLTDFETSETLRLKGGEHIETFDFVDQQTQSVNDRHGRGTRLLLRGISPQAIEKTVDVVLYERFPGLAVMAVTYRNVGTVAAAVEGWVNAAHVLHPPRGGVAEFCSFSGASYDDRRDWVQRLAPGFDQRNFMGMNASDYGGGTPVVDVWRRDFGLAVGHLETVPKLVALPLTWTANGARVAVECNQPLTLEPGERLSTFETFVAAHRADCFATLDAYRRVLAERGMPQARVPAAAYEPLWCAWGYERDFTAAQVTATLPKAAELGLVWAGIDDGWQMAVGDWTPDPRKFPRGDADMRALVKAVRDAGMKPKLWIAPLAAHPQSELYRKNPGMLLLDENGQPQVVTWWDSLCLCPAYEKTVADAKAVVRKVMGDWGFAGLKLDGQHLNGVAPCYNRAHQHARPEESVERLQEFWKAIYEQAVAIEPDAVIEICPCGTAQAFHHMPYMNQPVASDPESSWQVRHKGKVIKALMGPAAAYAGDHVELSDGGDDFASTVGIGGIVSTKFTWPRDLYADRQLLLTPQKEAQWHKWISLCNEKKLPQGAYRGELYDIGFDKPEAHAVTRDGRHYFAFYADRWQGEVELRGLGSARYSVRDYWTDRMIGIVSASVNRLAVSFDRFLLLEATPMDGA